MELRYILFSNPMIEAENNTRHLNETNRLIEQQRVVESLIHRTSTLAGIPKSIIHEGMSVEERNRMINFDRESDKVNAIFKNAFDDTERPGKISRAEYNRVVDFYKFFLGDGTKEQKLMHFRNTLVLAYRAMDNNDDTLVNVHLGLNREMRYLFPEELANAEAEVFPEWDILGLRGSSSANRAGGPSPATAG